ncbi:helix-turn-helix transcriptional regulator [Vibrio sp. RE86]|nr:helix-turn-helix transcriptional regulator [Vibrio sp. RE86]
MKLVKKEDVALFLQLFKDVDDNIYSLLRSANIPNDINNDVETYQYLPETTLKNILQMLGDSNTKEEYALNVWSFCKQVYIPTYVQSLTKGTTLKAALDEFSEQLQHKSSGAKVYTKYSGGKWWLVREKAYSDDNWFLYAEIFSVIFINELLSALTLGSWKPKEVGVQSHDLQDFLNLPQLGSAQFYTERPVTAFSIPEALMFTPVEAISAHSIQDQTIYSPLPTSFLSSFQLAIEPYLSMGRLPIKLASEILNINTRTLQRKLEAEGVVYQNFIEDLVMERIKQLLINSELSITEVASKMGYSDSAHFTRAFKRTMKMTPSQYRKSGR